MGNIICNMEISLKMYTYFKNMEYVLNIHLLRKNYLVYDYNLYTVNAGRTDKSPIRNNIVDFTHHSLWILYFGRDIKMDQGFENTTQCCSINVLVGL